VVMRRVEDFPDRSDKWLHFTKPRIPVVELDGPLVIPAGQPAQFELEIQHEGEPFPVEELEKARYMMFDGAGRMVLEGDAEPASEAGVWKISVSAAEMTTLGTGANSLEVAVTSHRVALPTFATHGFATIPAQTGTE
jgi:peptide/nickel transport system substrate-binding protein